jgi:hypothetical protein
MAKAILAMWVPVKNRLFLKLSQRREKMDSAFIFYDRPSLKLPRPTEPRA